MVKLQWKGSLSIFWYLVVLVNSKKERKKEKYDETRDEKKRFCDKRTRSSFS